MSEMVTCCRSEAQKNERTSNIVSVHFIINLFSIFGYKVIFQLSVGLQFTFQCSSLGRDQLCNGQCRVFKEERYPI